MPQVNSRRRAMSPPARSETPVTRRRRRSFGDIHEVKNLTIRLREANRQVFKSGILRSTSWYPVGFCFSLDVFFRSLKKPVEAYLNNLRNEPTVHKVFMDLEITYTNIVHETKHFDVAHRTTVMQLTPSTLVSQLFKDLQEDLENRNVNYVRNKSGLVIHSIKSSTLHTGRYNTLTGASYVELPKVITRKRAVINVKNTDNRCFGYAILAAKYKDSAYKQCRNSAKQYDRYFESNGLLGIVYPVAVSDLPMVEAQIGQAINVVSFYDDSGYGMYPVYHSAIDPDNAINLLYWRGHYAWISDFPRLMSGVSKHSNRKYFCMRCFSHFNTGKSLENHRELCTAGPCQQIMTMAAPGSVLNFRNTRYQQMCPFVVYADFECLLPRVAAVEETNDGEDITPTHYPNNSYQTHEPCSVGFVLVSTVPHLNIPYEQFVGKNIVARFLNRLIELETICMAILFDDKRMIITEAVKRDFQNAKQCYICNRDFTANDTKVRDHDHLSGAYRGAAHQRCNLLLRKQYKIPVFLHNFRGYDSHLVVTALGDYRTRLLSVIGQGMEKYLCLGFGDHLVFKDSLQFLGASLESLSASLAKNGTSKFQNLRKAFPNADEMALLIRKGVYPYDYMNSWERFTEQQLPPIEAFYSRLRQETCSPEDYEHAKKVWTTLRCTTLKDYHDVYLKTDVLLLADSFEEFRKVCMKNYLLDPAYYVSAPHLSWDAMLKSTKCQLELISDSEMYRMLDNSLRGGIAMITKRYARANNPRLGPDNYDPNRPQSHIMYWDANNLYGWAMSQCLPESGFRWLTPEEFERIDWLRLKKDTPVGYFVECDLTYPANLHDDHNDYPLAPERAKVSHTMLSDKQVELHLHYNFNRSTSYSKLVPNLFSKEKYCLHYRNLKFYLKHGLILRKVHRVIEFKQSKWMESYIKMNQDLRAASTEAFEQDFYKIMNNSCYGKTCENQRKRTDIKLVNDELKAMEYLSKPNLLGFKIFTKDLAAVNLMKPRCLINRPFYVGFTVLELSKLHMYKFHYDFVKQKWPGEQSQLLFTDTDSLMYEIQTDKLYETIWEHRNMFDLSNMPANFYHARDNNKVIGKFKDESGGEEILEFVGLRPKMYSFISVTSTGIEHHKKRAKGIQRQALNEIRHNDYLRQLHNPRENAIMNRRIGAHLHKVFTYEFEKRGLCAFDDKRYILDDGITTLAYGHKTLQIPTRTTVNANRYTFQTFSRVNIDNIDISDEEDLNVFDPDQVAVQSRLNRLEEQFADEGPANMYDLADYIK
jgi:hypothetical protein